MNTCICVLFFFALFYSSKRSPITNLKCKMHHYVRPANDKKPLNLVSILVQLGFLCALCIPRYERRSKTTTIYCMIAATKFVDWNIEVCGSFVSICEIHIFKLMQCVIVLACKMAIHNYFVQFYWIGSSLIMRWSRIECTNNPKCLLDSISIGQSLYANGSDLFGI